MIYIDLRGCSEPFLEGGAAELHNEDYIFSNEISLKFQNQPKFWRFRQISLSKMWLELWREHENPHHFLVSKISDFVSPKATRGPEAREMAKPFANSEAVSRSKRVTKMAKPFGNSEAVSRSPVLRSKAFGAPSSAELLLVKNVVKF